MSNTVAESHTFLQRTMVTLIHILVSIVKATGKVNNINASFYQKQTQIHTIVLYSISMHNWSIQHPFLKASGMRWYSCTTRLTKRSGKEGILPWESKTFCQKRGIMRFLN